MKWTKEEIHHQTWMSETTDRQTDREKEQQKSTSSIRDIKENGEKML
jgi:hypothetical protein